MKQVVFTVIKMLECRDFLITCSTDQTFIYSKELILLSVLDHITCDLVHDGELYNLLGGLKKIVLLSVGINMRL